MRGFPHRTALGGGNDLRRKRGVSRIGAETSRRGLLRDVAESGASGCRTVYAVARRFVVDERGEP